ncbi:Stk1 family PASTA domain-containing Ser/Thr kinase [Microbacterium sp.]|uniref:Stk1 family PASTA domain-containing Ser/Thr kinase n=1 Tax=Microbacterium sp. TaxID=51671 RepID=UPI001AD24D94|nr:Stk1 family PASTA domain-containing Ser/Thr kinase [Microbacterium sp.]MBN9184760.1 Stk1 family PASTA domain-containing Ser/Thr kinase [Microbacterium sp.]MBN9192294.1 Stk1 family PASTA domain-containing Ser/Thr kinase [Microbacterium sp.]
MTAEPRVLSGRYRVDELIGRGGMASVYRGYDLTLGRDVAIKILKRELAEDSAFRTRFRLEAQAASRMSNPAIVRVYDAGEDSEAAMDGTISHIPYIVMELVHGRLLKDILTEGPVPVADAVRYTDGILEALEYSHRAGVVHRDIKPGNVMVTDAGQVKVMDFGIARAVSDSSSTVAETTTILGTAAYFSPEQAKGEAVDARADLYSTGVVLYELLTGRQPFRGDSPVAVAYQHVSETPVPPTEVVDSLPRALDAVVLRALAKDPFQRFPDAATFRDALDAATDGKAPTKREVGALTSELYGPNPRQAAETARSLRQLSTDTTMKRTQSGPPVAWIWAGVALLAVLLISVLFWVVTIHPGSGVPSGARIVPDVAGLTFDQAKQKLAAEDLLADRVDQPDDSTAKGDVIRTDPGKGVSVAKGQQITIYVSSGPDVVAVPKLVGLTQAAAQQALDDAGLMLGAVTPRDDPDLAAGIVIAADREPGATVPKGTAVNIVAATGTVTIVDVTGWTVDDAKSAFGELKLTVTVQDDASCPAENPRTVRSQSIAPGEAPIHSTITLTSCSGS